MTTIISYTLISILPAAPARTPSLALAGAAAGAAILGPAALLLAGAKVAAAAALGGALAGAFVGRRVCKALGRANARSGRRVRRARRDADPEEGPETVSLREDKTDSDDDRDEDFSTQSPPAPVQAPLAAREAPRGDAVVRPRAGAQFLHVSEGLSDAHSVNREERSPSARGGARGSSRAGETRTEPFSRVQRAATKTSSAIKGEMERAARWAAYQAMRKQPASSTLPGSDLTASPDLAPSRSPEPAAPRSPEESSSTPVAAGAAWARGWDASARGWGDWAQEVARGLAQGARREEAADTSLAAREAAMEREGRLAREREMGRGKESQWPSLW